MKKSLEELTRFYEERVMAKAEKMLERMEVENREFDFYLEGVSSEEQTFKFAVIRRFSNGGSKFLGYRTYSLEEERIV